MIYWYVISIIIIYHDFLSTPRRGSHVKPDKTHTQSSRYIPLPLYLTPEPWFSVVVPFLQCIPSSQPHHVTASPPSPCDNHQSMGGRSKRTQCKAKMAAWKSFSYVPGLSTLSDLLLIVTQPPLSFLCCLRLPSHHPSSLTSVFLGPVPHWLRAINTLLAIRYSSILSTCPNHLNTLWSALLDNSPSIPALLCTSSFLTIHSRHSKNNPEHKKTIWSSMEHKNNDCTFV